MHGENVKLCALLQDKVFPKVQLDVGVSKEIIKNNCATHIIQHQYIMIFLVSLHST